MVAVRGADLEIQVVADVSRLKQDMNDMQLSVKKAAEQSAGHAARMATGVGVAASQIAASAQASSRAAMGFAGGMNNMAGAGKLAGHQLTNLSFQINDVVSGLIMGQRPFQILAQQGGQFFQIIQQSGLGAKGFAMALLQMVGVLKTTTDAEAAYAAASTKASADAIRARVQETQSNILAADTRLALAEAGVRNATTSKQAAIAQTELARAHQAVAKAAAQATIAEDALTGAMAAEAEAATAAAAATTTALTPLAVVIAGVLVVLTALAAAFSSIKREAGSDAEMQKFAQGLGLTKKEMEKLKDVSITWGDTFHGLMKTISDLTGITADDIKNFFGSAWKKAGDLVWGFFGVVVGAFMALSKAADAIGNNIRVALGDGFTKGANLAIDALNWLSDKAFGILKFIVDGMNKAFGTSLKIAAAAPKIDHMQTPTGYVDVVAAAKQGYDAGQAAVKGFRKAWADNTRDAAEQRLEKQAQDIIDDRNAKHARAAKQQHDRAQEALDDLDRQIKAQWELAGAYMEGDAAAMRAEARAKAEQEAQRTKGEVALFYEKELALAIANRAAEGAKSIRELQEETKARRDVNQMVESGYLSASQASRQMEFEAKLRPLLAAYANAEGKEKERLRDIMHGLEDAYKASNAQLDEEARLRQQSANSDDIDKLQLEAKMIHATNRERAVALAQLEAQKFLRDHPTVAEDPTKAAALVQSYVDAANAATDLSEAQNNLNTELSSTVDMLKLIGEQAAAAGQLFADAFGPAGQAVSDIIGHLTTWQTTQAQINYDASEAKKKAGNDAQALARIEEQARSKSAASQMQAIGGVITATKSMFKEHSTGYKVMGAIEKAYAVASLALTVAQIGPKIAAGAATMFAILGPFAFPAIAAMIAVMAALGFSGGGGSSKPPTSPEDLQKAAGTGTVLGDPTGKSASIENSLSLMAANSVKGLDASHSMVLLLRGIKDGIGELTASIARTLNASGGFFDTTGKLGTSSSGIQGLFGSTTTKSLYDQGITLNAATLQQILEQGITGSTYQVIETIKKKSGFLGIGGGTKTSYTTSTGSLDGEITQQMDLVIKSLYDSVVAAAKVLGIDAAEQLKQFEIEIGKLSFQGLTGPEIQAELEAVFSKLGDQMAGFAVEGLEGFQKAGEGLFETLMRLAKDYMTIDEALKSIGMEFGSVGAASVEMRESLIELSGGLDQFVSQVQYFYDNFLTTAQQTAFQQQQVEAAFAAMGVAVPATVEDFAALVTGLDLSTEAGQAMYAQLMAIAPAFYQVATAADQLAKAQQQLQVQLLQAQGKTQEATELQRQIQLASMDPALQDLQKQVWAAQDAAAAAAAALQLSNDRMKLQIQLLEAQGKSEEAVALQRKMALAELDPTLRALQKQVWAAQDVATARSNLLDAYHRERDELQATVDKFQGFAEDLKKFRAELFMDQNAGGGYRQALVNLMQQSGLAVAGNEEALGGGLQDAASTFMDVARANASSLQDVQRARALVAQQLDAAIIASEGKATVAEQQLDQLKTQVGALVDINESVLSVAQAIQQLNDLLAAQNATPPPSTTTPPTHTKVPHTRPDRGNWQDQIRDRMGQITGGGGSFGSTNDRTDDILGRIDLLSRATEANTLATNRSSRVLTRADRGGALAVVTDPDAPLDTTGTGLELA
jgi:hypothetical protein